MTRNLHYAIVLAFAGMAFTSIASLASDFPDVTGVWSGSYNSAFAEGHGHFGGEKKGVRMELHVLRQDGNLFWAENRWRLDDGDEWHVEHTTGTFDLLDPTTVSIVENSPNPDYGSTGYFSGKLSDEKLYLIYRGLGAGISFSAVLERN